MKRTSLLFALCFVVALGGFELPGEGAGADEVTIRVTAADSAAAYFNALFRTRTDTLVSEESVVAPKTFKIEEPQFMGYIRPLKDARLKVEVRRAGLRSSRSASSPFRVIRDGNHTSISPMSPEDLE